VTDAAADADPVAGADADPDVAVVAGAVVELVDADVEQPLVTAKARAATPIRFLLRLSSLIDFIVPLPSCRDLDELLEAP
jgi:hypothetical protein